MTKLSVAEASKRGYATGMSILQAVQKNWLSAEKGCAAAPFLYPLCN